MALTEGLLKLRWNNHEATFSHILHRLRSKPRYSDATLACEGRLFMVHRLVLATCSDFFDEIFQQTPSDTTRAVIVLNEARAQDVESLLDYMYCGQVNVRQANLASLLKTAECLKIKGLAVPEASVGISNAKHNQDYLESPPPKKKRKKKATTPSGPTPPLATSSPSDHLIIPPPPLSSSAWHQPNETPKFLSGSQSRTPPAISTPVTSSPHDLPLLHTSTASSQSIPLSVPVKVTVPTTADVDKANTKAGWLQIVSSMRQGQAAQQTAAGQDDASQNQQHKQNVMHSKKAMSAKSSSLENHPSQFLQTEIKEEVKEELVPVSLGPDDPIADEDNSWDNSAVDHQESGDRSVYRKVPSMYPPPPGLHPVVSGSGLTHTSPVLQLGLFRVGPYSVSGGQAWENTGQLRQSPEPGNHEALPSASQQPMDLGLNHLLSINKKGSSPNQATMSPKMMPYAMCSNCGTNNTKLWRRNDKGEIVCNACGLYFKLHGINRPSHLFRTAPMTRRRNPKKKKETDNVTTEHVEQFVRGSMEPIVCESSQDKEQISETDQQDGLAVLNAALTLNSLFAKAKAQQSEAALAAQRATPPITNKSNSDSASESRPPPPPLLKIPVPVREQDSLSTGPSALEPSREDSPQDPGGTHTPSRHSPNPSPPPASHPPPLLQPPPPLSSLQPPASQPPPPQESNEGRKFIAQLLDK